MHFDEIFAGSPPKFEFSEIKSKKVIPPKKPEKEVSPPKPACQKPFEGENTLFYTSAPVLCKLTHLLHFLKLDDGSFKWRKIIDSLY